jgi:D-alanine-D-alanine ligase
MKKNIALLAGGISSEREVSLNSGEQVYQALDKTKYEVRRYDPQTDLPRLVADASEIDAALIILHGPYGEDGTIQGLLELLDIPYQGTGVLGSALAMNKLAAKQMYENAGLPVPAYAVILRESPGEIGPLVQQLGLPLVVKPANAGSSIGMSIVRTADELAPALSKAFEHDPTVVVERFVQGIEITVGVLGNEPLEALPAIEIIPGRDHEFFDYTAKYTPGATREICPARIDDAAARKAQQYAQTAHRALYCKGYSRTDMILCGEDIFVLETNTIPGMTPTSLFPQAAQAAGISFGQLLDRLIELGIQAHHHR